METFRLWLEDDGTPLLKKLAFEKVEVAIADVLTKGIHPWQGKDTHRSLSEKFAGILNSRDMKPPELVQFGYCEDIFGRSSQCYCDGLSPFEELLQRISENVYFVDALTYAQLLAFAKEELKRNWSHQLACSLLCSVYSRFESMRSFLKSRIISQKVTGFGGRMPV